MLQKRNRDSFLDMGIRRNTIKHVVASTYLKMVALISNTVGLLILCMYVVRAY